MKHFSRALIWLTISEIIFNLAGYIIHASLGRILGPQEYGRFGVTITLTTMVIILLGNGIPTAMSKFLAENFETHPGRVRTIKRTAAWLQLVVMGSGTMLFYLLASFIAGTILRDASLTPLFQISAFVVPAFALASFYFYYYTGLHFFRLQAALKTLRSLARIIFIVGLAYLWGVEGAISGYILAPLVVFLVAWLYDIFKVSPTIPPEDKTFLFPKKNFLDYAWPFTLFLIFYELVLTADLYFVKALLQSDYLTGLYNATITVGRIPYYLFYALTILLLPAIAKAKTITDMGEVENLLRKTLLLLYALLLPMVSFLFLYGKEVMTFFYGSRFLEAVPSFQIFVFGAGFLTVFYVLAFALHGAGKVRIPMWLSFIGIITLSIGNFLLIPLYQLEGAALSITLTSLLLAILILVFLKKEFVLSLLPKTFCICFLSTGILTAAASLVPVTQWTFIPVAGFFFLLHLIVITSTKTIPLSEFLKTGQKKEGVA